jgi:hypothetical protein
MKRVSLSVLLAVALLCAPVLLAQVSTSTISGTVTDKTGAVIPGAKVTATDEGRGIKFETTTTQGGSYSFASMVVGSYTITVEAANFQKFVSKNNVLTVGSPLVVNAQLEVGAVTSVVEVSSTYERLNTSDATISDVVDRKAIRELPLNGRNPLALITLQPGLIQRSSGGAGSGTHVNGSRDRAFNVTLDGIDINEPSVPNPQNNVFRLTTDNVQEYRVVTHNATAEFGRNSGANIALASRSGTNEIHGNAYEYFRNPVLNANDWFNNLLRQSKPIYKVNQFGADVGGPIIKDKTHYFFSWQGQRVVITLPISRAGGIRTIYTSQAKQGIFRYVVGTVNGFTRNDRSLVDSSGNLLPGIATCSVTVTTNCIASFNVGASDPLAVGLDATMMAYIRAMPDPNDFANVGDGLNTGGFNWNPPSLQPEQRFLIRIDHQFNANNSIFGRYTWAFADTKEGDLLNSRPRAFPGFPPQGEVYRRPKNLALSYRRVFTPRLVNEFTAGFSRFTFTFPFGGVNPAFPNIPPFSLPNISEPFTVTFGTRRALTTIQYIDNVSYSFGKHMLRGGINFRFIQHNDKRSFVGAVDNAPVMSFGSARVPVTGTSAAANPNNPYGVPLTGAASASNPFPINTTDQGFLRNMISEMLGLYSGISQSFFAFDLNSYTPSGLYLRGPRQQQYNAYLQDEWKIRRNLTLNLGVRWEWNRPVTEAQDLIFRPDRAIDGSAGLVTYIQANKAWDRSNANALGPRVGLAWDPFANGKWVVRAGYGIMFDTISTFQTVPILGLVPGSSASCSLSLTEQQPGGSGTPFVTNAALTANCTMPANPTARVAAGAPQSLPQPAVTPSFFTSPAVQASNTAPIAGLFDPNLQVPTVHEWTLNIQRDLGRNMVLQVGYLGKRGTHLFRAYDREQLRLDPAFISSFIIARDNLINCGTAYGTATCGNTNVGVLAQILPGTTLNQTTSASRLRVNAAGSLAALIDSNGVSITGITAPAACAAPNFNSFCMMTNVAGLPANYFRPNPQFRSIFYFDAGGDSYYHALQITLRKQLGNPSYGFSYTLGKSIDNMSVDPVAATSGGAVGNNSRTPTDIYNFNVDRGRSDFDRRQIFNGYIVYELPFGRGQKWANGETGFLNQLISGWSVNSLMLIMTGEPFSILSGQLTNSNIRGSRVDLANSDVIPGTGVFHNVGTIVGPVVFAPFNMPQTNISRVPFRIPAPGTNGNTARNMFTGPGFWVADISISKRFVITEQINLQFRAEMFNAFNHPNFDNPLTSTNGSTAAFAANTGTYLSPSANANFGRVCCTAVATPSTTNLITVGEAARVIQFALRLSW